MYSIGKYSAARFHRDSILLFATFLLTLGFAVWAAAQPSPSAPTPTTSETQPAAPTGGGPTGENPAPPPPPDQRVILPSASGHINSAAPTMHRNCDAASPQRPGTAAPAGSSDPCMRDATPADQQRTPEMSK